MRLLLGAAAGYLIGSIPFAILIARLLGRFDTLRQGTRNPGATNVFKNVGMVAGALVGLLDYFKALVPALVARWSFDFGFFEAAAVGVAAVVGHDFSLFLKFRGGKGGASTLGVFSFLDFPALIATGLLWAVTLPFTSSRRFVVGTASLMLFPLLTALHLSPWGAALLSGWRPPGFQAVWIGVALVALAWARIALGAGGSSAEGTT
jgi:glycerol-3-phosphate acyltransferase PlsY